MALYAIGDLHLGFEVNKPMDIFNPIWKNHWLKIKDNWEKVIKEDDTVVITGDVSWGNKLLESEKDLEFISNLKGRKILIRGNHDRFWDVKKTNKLNKKYDGVLHFMQNNYYVYENYALIGTKGYFDENENGETEESNILYAREIERLHKSYLRAKIDGYEKFLVFLHMPPNEYANTSGIFTEFAEKIKAEQVVYSHLHGEDKYKLGIQGVKNGIEYSLVSADYLEFMPKLIMI